MTKHIASINKKANVEAVIFYESPFGWWAELRAIDSKERLDIKHLGGIGQVEAAGKASAWIREVHGEPYTEAEVRALFAKL